MKKPSKRVTVSPKVVRHPAQAEQQRDWSFKESPSDPLAAAISTCLRLRGRDVGEQALVLGIALDAEGKLSPKTGVRALEAHGFRAHITRRAIRDLPVSVLPAVLFTADRNACVLVSQNSKTAKVVWPTRSDSVLEIPLAELEDAYSGHTLLFQMDVQHDPEATAQKPLRHWYWSVVSKFWPDFGQVVLASALINVLALAVPIFTMNVYDRVFPNAAIITLWSLVLGVGLALAFDAILKWIRAGVVDQVSRRVDLAVSSELFRHIADLRLDAEAQPAGTMINNLKDYEQVRDFFSSQTLASLTDLVFSFLFIAVIAYIGGPLAWPPAIALGVVILIGLIILAPLRSASNAARQTSGVKNAVAVEAITDLETLKSISGQNRMQARWERQVAESARAQERSKRLANFATTLTGLAQQVSSIGIVIIGVYLALEGNLTMGAVIAAMILSGRAMAPTAALAGLFVRAGFAVSTLRSLNALMARASDKSAPDTSVAAITEDGAFELRNVSLQYAGAKVPAIKNISLTTKGQERIGIVGPVGAGKTSLVRALSGLYAPTEGMVLLDGLNMSQLGSARLRRDVQLVPQEAVLFSGTLAENIAFGMPQASSEELMRVARLAGVDRIAAAHPQGFAMPITERGRNLSGGQRQMVALARAVLPRPRVLILDEPTSSMDTQSEKLFAQSLARVLEQWPMTLIVSTHRMGLLDLVDRLILLDRGALVMDDSKEQVMKRLQRNEERPTV